MRSILDYIKVFKNIETYKEPRSTALGPRNTYSEGQLVTPNVDGSRPGYGGVDYTDEANKIVNDYKKHIAKDFSMKGDLSKAPALDKYLQNRFGKNYKNVSYKIKKFTNFDSRGYLQEQKLNLAEGLVTKSNNGLKWTIRDDILKKIGGYKPIKGETEFSKKLFKTLDKLDPRETKVIKAFEEIIDSDLPVKKSTKVSPTVQKMGSLKTMIVEMTGVDPNSPDFKSGTKKSYTKFAKKFDVSPKEFEIAWNYLNQTGGRVSNLNNVPFNQAFNFAKDRVKGAMELGGLDNLRFYRDSSDNVLNYIWRSWNGNNLAGTESRVKLYDRSKLKIENGKLVPKKGYKLKDIEIKWKTGGKIPVSNIAFTYDGSELFDKVNLKTRGKESGLFKHVDKITKDYYTLYNRPVPDPKNIGKEIKFGEMMIRDYGKNSLTIGHNAPGGVKVEPLKNFQIQSQKMNIGLYNATKHIKNKALQKQVIETIYGDLHNLKGDKYIEKFIKNPPNIGYKEAGQKVIKEAGADILQWGPKKQTEALRVAGIDLSSPEGRLKFRQIGTAKVLNKILEKNKIRICNDKLSNGKGVVCGATFAERDPNAFMEAIKRNKDAVKIINKPGLVKGALRGVSGWAKKELGPFGWIGSIATIDAAFGLHAYGQGKTPLQALDETLWFLPKSWLKADEKMFKNVYERAGYTKEDFGEFQKWRELEDLDQQYFSAKKQTDFMQRQVLMPNDKTVLEKGLQKEVDLQKDSPYANMGWNRPLFAITSEEEKTGKHPFYGPAVDRYNKIMDKSEKVYKSLKDPEKSWKDLDYSRKLAAMEEANRKKQMTLNKWRGYGFGDKGIEELLTRAGKADSLYSEYVHPIEGPSVSAEQMQAAGFAGGGRAGYMGGGIASILKPSEIPPERGGLRSIMINAKDN